MALKTNVTKAKEEDRETQIAQQVQMLIQDLHSNDQAVQERAMGSLVAWGNAAVEPLMIVLQDKNEDPYVRALAAQVLYEVGGTRPLNAFITILSHMPEEDWGLRMSILNLLVAPVLTSDQPEGDTARIQAWRSVLSNDPNAISVLARIVSVTSGLAESDARMYAAEALALYAPVGDGTAINALLGALAEQVQQPLTDRNAIIVVVAALGELGTPETARALSEQMRTYPNWLAVPVQEAIDMINERSGTAVPSRR